VSQKLIFSSFYNFGTKGSEFKSYKSRFVFIFSFIYFNYNINYK